MEKKPLAAFEIMTPALDEEWPEQAEWCVSSSYRHDVELMAKDGPVFFLIWEDRKTGDAFAVQGCTRVEASKAVAELERLKPLFPDDMFWVASFPAPRKPWYVG